MSADPQRCSSRVEEALVLTRIAVVSELSLITSTATLPGERPKRSEMSRV